MESIIKIFKMKSKILFVIILFIIKSVLSCTILLNYAEGSFLCNDINNTNNCVTLSKKVQNDDCVYNTNQGILNCISDITAKNISTILSNQYKLKCLDSLECYKNKQVGC